MIEKPDAALCAAVRRLKSGGTPLDFERLTAAVEASLAAQRALQDSLSETPLLFRAQGQARALSSLLALFRNVDTIEAKLEARSHERS